MNKERKRLQNKLRRKYGWHTSGRVASDRHCFIYKFVKGPWVFKHPELGRSTVSMDVDINSCIGDVCVSLTEEYCESENKEFDRTISITLSFEELESLYLIAKGIEEVKRNDS